MTPLRVLVADDHPVFREGLCALLGAFPEVQVVEQAANGTEAVEATARTAPHVILMDLQMPGCNGIEAIRRIHDTSPDIAVVVLTMFDDDRSVFAALRAGARGYLLKDADAVDVLRAIRTVATGEAIFGPAIAQRLITYFSTIEPQHSHTAFPELTTGEQVVLDLIAAGYSNTEIASRLRLSPKTVRNRISSIFSKLHIRDRAEAIVRGRQAGLGNTMTGPASHKLPGRSFKK